MPELKSFAGALGEIPHGNAVLKQHHTHSWLLLHHMLSSVNMCFQWIVSTTSKAQTPAMEAYSRLM